MLEAKGFVEELVEQAVILQVVDGQLKIDGPASVLNHSTCDKLRRLKPEIIHYITTQQKNDLEASEEKIVTLHNKAFPLSYTQLCFWFVNFALKETANNLSRLLFTSPIALENIEKALHSLVSKHAIFNVSIGEVIPLQHLKEVTLPPLEVIDLRQFDNEQQNEMVSKDIIHLMRPFDLSTPPLIRYQYYLLSENESLLVCCFPHIVLDGAAVHLFEQTLMQTIPTKTLASNNSASALIHTTVSKPEPLYQYVFNQRKVAEKSYESQLAYWQDSLKGYKRARFPTKYLNHNNSQYVDREIVIPSSFLEQVHQCCIKKRVSMHMIIITVICQAIRVITAERKFVVNSVMENRISDHEAQLMAPILYLLPTPVEISEADDFEQTLEQIKKHNKSAQDNMDIPFSVPQGLLAAERWDGWNKPLASMIKMLSRMLSFILPSAKLYPSFWSDYFLTANPPFASKKIKNRNNDNQSSDKSSISVVPDPVININLLPNTYKQTFNKADGAENIISLSDNYRYLPAQALDGSWEDESIDFYVSKDSKDNFVFRVTCCCLNDSGLKKIEQELQRRMLAFAV